MVCHNISIGGTIQITYLEHHGIKGQHWGVRRGPPYPLDKTVSKLNSDDIVRDIAKSLSKYDKYLLALDEDEEYDTSINLIARFIVSNQDVPVSVFDIENANNVYNVSVLTRSGDKYRGKGYASEAVKRGMDWWEKNKDKFEDKPLSWWAREENPASNKLAIKSGFTPSSSNGYEGWKHYTKR